MSVTDPAHAPSSNSAVLGTIEAIFVTPAAGAPMRALEQVRALAGRGLEGDRYADGVGTYSTTPGSGRHVTMIDAAALEALAAEGLPLAPHECRRNIVTRGVALLDLIGSRVWVGEALCVVTRECAPCQYLESLTRPGMLKALVGRGGARLEVLRDGLIRRGDAIRRAE